jgi:TonB family protein
MKESDAASIAAAKARSDEPSTMRLVIRAEIIPDEIPEPTQPRPYKLLAIAGAFALLLALIWFAVNAFTSDSAPTRLTKEASSDSRPQSPAPRSSSEAAPVVSSTPVQPPSSIALPPSPASNSKQAKSIAPDLPTEPALPKPIDEVVPDVPRSALQTIRGTIRVSIQVTIDQQGSVVAATSQVPGPSRYFERLSLEAARKWRFAPTSTAEQRTALVRFHFTQDGATARAGTVDE